MDEQEKKHLEEHREEFKKIISKYNLMTQDKAEGIAKFLIGSESGNVSVKDFAEKYLMDEHEAYIFLSFIHKGIKFKEDHLDKKDEEK